MHLTKYKQKLVNDLFRWDEESLTTKVSTEIVQTSLPFAPPSSPNPSLSKRFNTSSGAQELVKAIMDMEIASSLAPNCTCSHTPPEDASEATPTEPCSPAPSRVFPANQTLAHKLEFKTVNEVYVPNGVIKLWLTIHPGGMRKILNIKSRNLQ
jgi:hypothetical protein